MNPICKRRWCGALIFLIGLAGCGQSIATPADPEQTKDAIKIALEAWKKGAAMESLGSNTPPIEFYDARWTKGHRLMEYKILESRQDGRMQRFRIKLTMEDKDGSPDVQEVDYIADTGPKIVINQADIES